MKSRETKKPTPRWRIALNGMILSIYAWFDPDYVDAIFMHGAEWVDDWGISKARKLKVKVLFRKVGE
jgi:hypothetical protein